MGGRRAEWLGEAPHGLLPRPLACADKRRDPEEGRVGAERGAFYKGTAPPLQPQFPKSLFAIPYSAYLPGTACTYTRESTLRVTKRCCTHGQARCVSGSVASVRAGGQLNTHGTAPVARQARTTRLSHPQAHINQHAWRLRHTHAHTPRRLTRLRAPHNMWLRTHHSINHTLRI